MDKDVAASLNGFFGGFGTQEAEAKRDVVTHGASCADGDGDTATFFVGAARGSPQVSDGFAGVAGEALVGAGHGAHTVGAVGADLAVGNLSNQHIPVCTSENEAQWLAASHRRATFTGAVVHVNDVVGGDGQ